MKIPGPDHPITISPAKTRWRVAYQNHVIADSSDVMILQEASYPPVAYFAREGVDMAYFSKTDRTTHCPYKGDASYYTILMDGHFAENAVWSYEEPFPAMEHIRGRLAFYPDKVEIYPVDDDVVDPGHHHTTAIDEAVLHTDSGSGASQRETWAPTERPQPSPPENA